MFKLYRFNIGANNETEELETMKALQVFERGNVEGLTYYETTGYWKGEEEKSLVVEVSASEQEEENMHTIAEELCYELDQEAVGMSSQEIHQDFVTLTAPE